MRKLLTVLVLVFLPAFASAVEYPVPRGFVNDYANIIPAVEESAMEKTLSVYNKKTLVEIAVVTTPSLDGHEIRDWSVGLASKWGVGKKGADNGLLIVVAPNERDYAIEVGYGLESYVPDGLANRLARESLPDAFRAGQYGSGLNKLIHGLMGVIGQQTPEERAKALADMKVAQQREADVRAQQFRFVFSIVIGVLIVAGLIFLIYKAITDFNKRRQEKLRQEKLRQKVIQQLTHFKGELKQVIDSFSPGQHTDRVPPWIVAKVSEYELEIKKQTTHFELFKKQVEALLTNNPDKAVSELALIEDAIKEIRYQINQLASVDDTIEQYRACVENNVDRAKDQVNAVRTLMKVMAVLGYRLPSKFLDARDQLIKDAKALTETFATRGSGATDRSDVVDDLASRLYEQADRVNLEIDSLKQAKLLVDKKSPRLEVRLVALKKMHQATEPVLAHLKKVAPSRVWGGLDKSFARINDSFAKVATLLRSANDNNTWEVQLFHEAESTVNQAGQLLDVIEQSCAEVTDLNQSLIQAEKDYPELHARVTAIIAKVDNLMTSDVSQATRSMHAKAKQGVVSAEQAQRAKPADWFLAHQNLIEAEKQAKTALKQVERDIAEAKKRRADEVAVATAAASISTSSFNTRSDPDSGFGGFGGGGFGGGGTSGKW